MLGYYLHTKNAQQALDAIAKGQSSVHLSTDLHLSEQDYSVSAEGLILD